MGADYSFELISIVHWVPQFFTHNKLILDGVEFYDGDYDDEWDIAPGDTALCTECLCKGMRKNYALVLKKQT